MYTSLYLLNVGKEVHQSYMGRSGGSVRLLLANAALLAGIAVEVIL